jgi:putative sigma-54 modulation protein
MDLVTLTVATDKVEFRCNAELSDAERTAAVERMTRLVNSHPELVRMYVDVERDPEPHHAPFIAKGQIEIEGPNLLASVADENALKSVEFLLENFDRQLRRRKLPRVRTTLRAPRTPPPPRS